MENSVVKTQHETNLAARKAEEAALRRYQATEWLDSLVGPLGISKQPSEREFISCLRTGLVLCNAINKTQPGSVQKVVETQLPSGLPSSDSQPLPAFQYFENVKNFLVAAQELKLTTFEAPILERDNLEAGASTKVVDCILELKALHDWKQMNGGNGFNKPPRTPFTIHSVGKMDSQVSEETSLGRAHRRLEMTASCNIETHSGSETQNLEELIVATLAQCMVDKKENIDANFLTSIRSRNPDALNSLCKSMSSCLQEQGQKMLPKVKPTLKDLLREEGNFITQLRTKVMESSIVGDKKCRGACSDKGYHNHEKLLKMQENELSQLKSLLSRTKAEFGDLQSQLQTDMKLLESQVQEMSTAALGYYKVVKENKNLHNKVQVLKGGLEKTIKAVDVSSEEAELLKELERLKTALSNKELQNSELSGLKEIKSPSDKSKSVTNETSKRARRLSAETFGIDRREKPQGNKPNDIKMLRSPSVVTTPPRLSLGNHSTQKVEKSSSVGKLSSVRRLSIENHPTEKVGKLSSVRRLSTGTSIAGNLGKAREPKGAKYMFEKAEAIQKRNTHQSRRLSSESGNNAKIAYLEDQKVLKTPVQNRIKRLSLEGPRYENKDFLNTQRPALPQAAISGSKPKAGDFRREVPHQMASKRPVSDCQVVRLEKDNYSRSQLIESSESQTASAKATTNGKKSQIQKSLCAIGKLINGSEKRMPDMKLPDPCDGRKLRRQTLAGNWSPVKSSTPSFGVKSSGNRLSRAVTPTPVRPSDKSPRRWH
ncbi:hypothetical protein ACET3Z_017768 [Daucus carota]